MSDKIKLSIGFIVVLFLGFMIGKTGDSSNLQANILVKKIQPEISLIQLKKISGDSLEIDVSGPARILWADKNLVENDGVYQIPLSQIPNENDLKYSEFPYTGNMKSMKFYPSDSYFARGVAPRYRRFFATKAEALSAGFIASKSVK